jgi:hypothetical protein
VASDAGRRQHGTYAANVLKVKKVGVIDDRTAFGQGWPRSSPRRRRSSA